ncbi:hypothetical protein WH95_09790 [Kiloniella litopenaei]|uniref:Zinc resistance-associated protein n=1 Tax=Kiloniella litopenaei TaxID=1549748 RepID=A0A0M2R5K2_9PROT|nr:periplasmic heavy metal sensor [Kiloniella litopenaei]KKJ76961.1 hypothetical protein WH95_09790 [Kiloniella litopenaei]
MPVPSKKVLTILFSISLALNIFMGGLIGSHIWHARTYGLNAMHEKSQAQRKQWRSLSSEQRDLFKEIWREHKSDIKSSFKDLRASHKKLKNNLKGKTERAEFEAAFDIFVAEQSEVHRQTVDKLLDIAMTLPPEDRSTFLSLWGTGPRHGRP